MYLLRFGCNHARLDVHALRLRHTLVQQVAERLQVILAVFQRLLGCPEGLLGSIEHLPGRIILQ